MSIRNAYYNALTVMRRKKWDTIYWAIDLHGVVFKNTYGRNDHEFISNDAITVLKKLSESKRDKIILWSSCHSDAQEEIIKFMKSHDINIDYFNENPEVENNEVSSFGEKFYFSILLDDKAGFNPDVDWAILRNLLNVSW